MKDLKAAVGRVAVSKAGRDKNRCFLICEIVDDEFVLVVDGALRKLSRPKKKKLKHLAAQALCGGGSGAEDDSRLTRAR